LSDPECLAVADSPFATFVDREPYAIFDGVGLRAIAGDQVFLGRVTYEPGTTVARHSHEHTEQVMLMLEGEIEMTIEEETRTIGPGDVVVVNPGLRHTLHSPNGAVFMEALAPVPLDHVPDRELDLVVGPDGGATHVER
jgi:quercetin dioxygenase-like cupin family protein